MRFERGLSTIPQRLEWYELVLRTRLPTPAVLYLVLKVKERTNMSFRRC